MQSTVEIINRFDRRRDLADIVYDRTLTGFTYWSTRFYHLAYRGTAELLRRFVTAVLADDISQEIRVDQPPAYPDAIHCIDVSLKPSVLDLEKEYTSRYLDLYGNQGLTVDELTITQRYYLFGLPEKKPELVRTFAAFGPINPVIHRYKEATL